MEEAGRENTSSGVISHIASARSWTVTHQHQQVGGDLYLGFTDCETGQISGVSFVIILLPFCLNPGEQSQCLLEPN